MEATLKKYLVILAACSGLTACATSTPALDDHSANFGTAVTANMEAQKVAPTPEQKANTYIPSDSARRALARENYRKDEVETPRPVGTMN